MTLPDPAFFELIRSVLGVVKTPFNKQRLLEDLSAFISRPDILKTMADLINDEDRRIIAAIALMGEPAPGEMESFFTGEYSYAELQGLLLNLEERLVIYRFREEGVSRIALNPKLEGILASIAKNRDLLFSSPEGDSGDYAEPPPAPPMDSRLLAALFAFFLKGEALLKIEGGGEDEISLKAALKKKALDEGNRIFPGLAQLQGFDVKDEAGETRRRREVPVLETLAGGLLVLGLLIRRGELFGAGEGRLGAFKELDDRGRFEYLAAGSAFYLYMQRLPEGFYMGRSLVKNLAGLIHGLIDSLETAAAVPEAALFKLIEILRREERRSWGFAGELPPSPMIIDGLLLSGLLLRAGKRYFISAGMKPAREGRPADKDPGKPPGDRPFIAMDSPSSCILYDNLSFADALDLAAFSGVEETGATVRFSFSRESAVRGFDRGLQAEFMWKLLDRLSMGRAGASLKWNLEDWEKRYRETALYQGLVLSLGGERAFLAETEALSSIIDRTLAPGIYLLSADREEAAAVLRAAGVDIVAQPGNRAGGNTGGNAFSFTPPAQLSPLKAGPEPEFPRAIPAGVPAGLPAEEIKRKFRDALERMKIGREEREELRARIERRMIVSESQLSGAALRYEKLEARSLDYVGKTQVVKQAIAAGSVLEVQWSKPSGQEKILGKPEALEKRGEEMILILRQRNGDELLRIPLGKISLLKRIKQSIFGE
jgi:hypothetical protein